MKRKLMALMLAGIMVIQSAGTSWAAEFTDGVNVEYGDSSENVNEEAFSDEQTEAENFEDDSPEKDLTEEEYGTLAKEVMNICSRYQVSCILHNFWKTALELGCTSVHLPLPILQKITDEEKKKFTKIGISIHSVEEAKEAEQLGASYLTAGHIYATDCKRGLPPRGLGFLKEQESLLSRYSEGFCFTLAY